LTLSAFIGGQECLILYPRPSVSIRVGLSVPDKDIEENGGDAAADEAVWPLERLKPYPCLARTGAKG
jgi:hypothetical protein